MDSYDVRFFTDCLYRDSCPDLVFHVANMSVTSRSRAQRGDVGRRQALQACFPWLRAHVADVKGAVGKAVRDAPGQGLGGRHGHPKPRSVKGSLPTGVPESAL